MGVDTRRPILPAPTESIIDTESALGTDLATDISRRTDKTSYSIPDDGSPLIVSTRDRDGTSYSHSRHDSHTSLLIEYFEGGKGSGVTSRPSVRVRVTPSSARKSKRDRDHVQITESSGSSRKPSYTHRISLPSPSSKSKRLESGAADDQSLDSNSAEEGHQSSRRHPVEIDFPGFPGSEMSTLSHDTRYMPVSSDISSMPADSMMNASSAGPRRKRSSSLERGSPREDKDLLKTPRRQRSRSLSTERIAHRVAEKLTEPPKESSGRNRSKSGKDYLDAEPKSSRRKHKYAEDDYISPESSLLSTSAVSSNRKSDQYSIRSGASKSSINNPKLLETVEDAIRRLILPELKELKKDQKVMTNTGKFERDMARDMASYSSQTSSRDELRRSLSKHASAPDIIKPKVILNKDSKDEGIVLSGGSGPQTKERKSSKSSEVSEAAVRRGNRPDYSEQDKIRRQRSKGLRDAHAAARVGSALTAASLKHHDSNSSLGKSEHRRRKSGSRKSTESMNYNETELVFQKHNVAPMPMRSEIDSELTRNSLLSEHTASPPPQKKSSQAELSRGSARQLASPTSRTPTRNSIESLGMRHANKSHHNISLHSASDRDLRDKSQSPGTDTGDWAIAAAAAANLLDAAHPTQYHDETHDRGLSPIQSVASDNTETHHAQYLTHENHIEGMHEMEPRLSIDSLSSAPSTNLARSTRQGTTHSHSQSALSQQLSQDSPGLGYERSRQPEGSDISYGYDIESRLTADDDNSDVNYMDKIKEGQHVGVGVAANPQFHQAMDVESNVASLMDPSVLESQIESQLSSINRSQTDLGQRPGSRSPEKQAGESYRGSPLKQRQDASTADETSFHRRMGATSPPQSVTQSYDEMDDSAIMSANVPRGLDSPMADAESQESESEINTNPSIIQGPAGGAAQRDHWAYNSRSPPVDQYYDGGAGPQGLSDDQQRGLDAEYYQTAKNIFGGEDYYNPSVENQARQLFGTPPGAKDEGYVSAANPMSPSIGTPKQGSRGLAGPDAAGVAAFDDSTPEDPFGPGHQRHFSGYSHGVGSPLYDSATGRGIERIQSQDIVALMDHLTVRDAQRNARDTEILVTLVRSAAEMRTSFEQMKKFIADQDDLIMDNTDRGHERTHKALGGPRPLPPSTSRNRQLNTAEEDDKRKNIFKRALKGLSLKSGNDLSKIEGMLEQLLEEVEYLRSGQDGVSPQRTTRPTSIDSAYEPAQNGAPIENSRAAYMSSPHQRRNSDQRVSTVHEVDEEDLELDEADDYMTGHLPVREPPHHERAGSLPLSTPPHKPVAAGARSTETTPKADKSDKARKHKSSSSSIFPKISRWSKSTATSVGDNIRNSIQPNRKERPTSDLSRSGSDLAEGTYKGDYYDPQGDDRIRSTYTLDDQQENRPPSPLVPSQVSEVPKYRGHRGSLELQHPQPRQGPTGRYQSRLETEAQTYGGPVSPTGSDQWESNPSLSAVNPNQQRFSGASRLSPISDAGYSETSSRTPGPPRPPKVKDEGPLVPERPQKALEDEEPAYGASADRVVSRSSAIRSPPTRKPTGPRPLTSGGAYSPGKINRTRYRGSPMQVDHDDEY
ncbi:hypothetical protein PENANT_c001G09319 [Penicillium antarcticum]|uniref:Uncharacterized protein n=1 Tax=Penicillium antarcticum TaxID=416450 RepID=A0A1V6QPD9_9EURO|nr:uncharacterized protein N7508_010767 [Penicillium antarcticum]KAJ5295946.1 hypothetical protein N7508_010767 [Penicillium antarcticum]OQD90806.1 hypothetical protein PENANT_c001G09319 [Penicillium antarcticum]